MKLENYSQIKSIVHDSDLILVGLGGEWMLTYECIIVELELKAPALAKFLKMIARDDRYLDVIAIVEAYFYKNYFPSQYKEAYCKLFDLVNDKNYFIVSLTTDTYLKQIGFKNDRIVNPCGSFEKAQCNVNCEEEILDSSNEFSKAYEKLDELIHEGDQISQEKLLKYLHEICSISEKLKCMNCQEKIVFNTLDALKYNEKGYLDNWQIYMKWLQGTVNKNLCILELGVGLEMPSVIRWPFEKTAFYNQKAKMIRIHHTYYQVNEEISDRSYGLKENAVKYIADV